MKAEKKSPFLKGLKQKGKNTSEARKSSRIAMGLRSDFPSSTKVGKGANCRVRRGYDVAAKKAIQYAKPKEKKAKRNWLGILKSKLSIHE